MSCSRFISSLVSYYNYTIQRRSFKPFLNERNAGMTDNIKLQYLPNNVYNTADGSTRYINNTHFFTCFVQPFKKEIYLCDELNRQLALNTERKRVTAVWRMLRYNLTCKKSLQIPGC